MPLVRIDMFCNKPTVYRRAICDAVCETVADVVGLPAEDCRGVVIDHEPENQNNLTDHFGIQHDPDAILVTIGLNDEVRARSEGALVLRDCAGAAPPGRAVQQGGRSEAGGGQGAGLGRQLLALLGRAAAMSANENPARVQSSALLTRDAAPSAFDLSPDEISRPKCLTILRLIATFAVVTLFEFFIVVVAVAELNADFRGSSLLLVSWAFNAYMLVGAAMVPAAQLTDLRRRNKGFTERGAESVQWARNY